MPGCLTWTLTVIRHCISKESLRFIRGLERSIRISYFFASYHHLKARRPESPARLLCDVAASSFFLHTMYVPKPRSGRSLSLMHNIINEWHLAIIGTSALTAQQGRRQSQRLCASPGALALQLCSISTIFSLHSVVRCEQTVIS